VLPVSLHISSLLMLITICQFEPEKRYGVLARGNRVACPEIEVLKNATLVSHTHRQSQRRVSRLMPGTVPI